MFYSLLKHRKSVGHQAAQFHENTTVEIDLDGHPVPDPAVHGLSGDQDDPRDEGHVGARHDDQGHRLPVEVELRLPARTASASTRTSSTPLAQIENREPKGEHYLLEVDNPLVVPVDAKVRVLITAGDVIHAWWVPAFGVKQDAIPGFVRDTWFTADKAGIYRGQCAELCGKEHGFMPIVVEVKSKDDYAKWRRRAEEEARRRRRRPEQGVGRRRTWSRAARRSSPRTAPRATRRNGKGNRRARRSRARRRQGRARPEGPTRSTSC